MESTTFTLRSGRTIGVTTFGQPDAEHVVVLVQPEGTEAFDPKPAVTAGRLVQMITVDPPGTGRSDPVSRDLSPVELAHDIAELLGARGIERVGVAGWGSGGWVALALAAAHTELVSRAAVVSTLASDDEGALDFSLDDVAAKTLLLFGVSEEAGSRDATWFKKRLVDARVEMNPQPGDPEVVARWDRILSHLAPGSKPR